MRRRRLLGILIDHAPAGPGPVRDFPEYAYAHLNEPARARGAAVALFCPPDIDLARKEVDGWTDPWGEGEWRRERLPLPDAIYNRISRRSVEASPACRRLLRRLGSSARLFNPRFLDKWEATRAIAGSAGRRYLPPTEPVQDPAGLLALLEAWGDLFLKPTGGSLGRGIVRIRRRQGRLRVEENRAIGEPPVGRHLSRAQLAAAFWRWRRSGPLLAQQTVERAAYQGRPFDLRLLVQRGSDGLFALTGAAGRLPGAGALTPHVPRGGLTIGIDRLREEASAPLPGSDELEAMSAEAARAVAGAAGGEWFEFSLDVAVRADGGGPVILEVNAKPFPFDEPEIRDLAARRLLDYSLSSPRPQPAVNDDFPLRLIT